MSHEWAAVMCPDEKIDALRKATLRAAEKVVSAASSGEHGDLAPLAQKLLSTAREQFEAEERRLREARAPSLVRHIHEHERFLADLGAMVSLATRGDAGGVVALRPERWIPDWMSAHASTDRDLAA